MRCLVYLLAVLGLAATATAQTGSTPPPDILFLVVDDLNDWVGCLGGHPQTRTPNLDRLARSGVLFTNAHCAAPSCNPSRTALFTGRSPATTGLYTNTQSMRDALPEAQLLPAVLRTHGYRALGSGKLLHYVIDAPSWDEYFPSAATESPIPRTLYPKTRPLSLPRAGAWQYVETDWGPLDATDEEYGGDLLVAEWIAARLRTPHDQATFLAGGLYRPHEPWFVPRRYFEPFPLESIQLPPGYREGDIDDLPAEGRRRALNRYFPHIQAQGQWRQAVQAYLAAIHYSDAMLGRILDALDASPRRDSTIVVLCSDHGWHLGEKEHWQKFTAWRVCTRVPLIVRVPAGVRGLPDGTRPAVCDQPVDLRSLFPTLLELAGLPPDPMADAPSLVPLLADVDAPWPHVAVTWLDTPGSFGLSDRGWRYIRYHDGGEELYDVVADPHEWENLAGRPEHAARLSALRAKAPTTFAPRAPERTTELVQHAADVALPSSRPEGAPAPLRFLNGSGQRIRIHWIAPDGERRQRAELEPNATHDERARKGAVWLVTDTDDRPLGHFVSTGQPSRALVR
ncbi:MAG: sulfatase-like hydrolase/transferase [Planctomycetes bacterium]|nr:sulfatase-like hydrolase/transferase [Planctomycetota bacterium]